MFAFIVFRGALRNEVFFIALFRSFPFSVATTVLILVNSILPFVIEFGRQEVLPKKKNVN